MKQTIKDEINKLYSLFKAPPKLDVKSTQQHLDTFTHRLVSKEAITPLKRAVNQIKSIGKCAWCGASKDKVQNGFRDELSKKEYQISALCQSCQDEVFDQKRELNCWYEDTAVGVEDIDQNMGFNLEEQNHV